MKNDFILEVSDLHISFLSEKVWTTAVSGLSFSLEKGQTLGIVGESVGYLSSLLL